MILYEPCDCWSLQNVAFEEVLSTEQGDMAVHLMCYMDVDQRAILLTEDSNIASKAQEVMNSKHHYVNKTLDWCPRQ